MALSRCQLYASSRSPVIFVGATGTGKSHFARYLPFLSPRRHQPFVDVTAAEVEGDLARDSLFGHEAGAFTGAVKRRIGLFEEAGGGTLLLDDLHLLSLSQQALLLRVMDRGVHRPNPYTGKGFLEPMAQRVQNCFSGGSYVGSAFAPPR